jgi:hypothetical protein
MISSAKFTCFQLREEILGGFYQVFCVVRKRLLKRVLVDQERLPGNT